MQYRNKTFTLPVNTRQMTDEDYEIAVGVRCPECRKPTDVCECEKPNE